MFARSHIVITPKLFSPNCWLLAIIIDRFIFFPIAYFVTKWRTKTYFKDFSPKQQLILFIASNGEWGFTFLAFFITGILLHEPVDVVKVFVIFIIGSAIGMFTLVPGGLGTFDLFVLYALTTLGTAKEAVVAWLL